VAATALSAVVETDADPNKYDWTYKISTLGSSKPNTKKLNISSKKASISETGLIPNTAYYLEVEAKDSASNVIKSPRVLINTKQDYPESVSNLSFNFANEAISRNSFYLAFFPPNSWGKYAANRTSRGYRISLIANNQILSYSDTLVTATNKKINQKIDLTDFFKNNSVEDFDTLQIGVQTWVKDAQNNYIFDAELPRCSQPIYLKNYLANVTKSYIKVQDKFKRLTFYNNIKN
jgi:hypothetical protein